MVCEVAGLCIYVSEKGKEKRDGNLTTTGLLCLVADSRQITAKTPHNNNLEPSDSPEDDPEGGFLVRVSVGALTFEILKSHSSFFLFFCSCETDNPLHQPDFVFLLALKRVEVLPSNYLAGSISPVLSGHYRTSITGLTA